MHDRLWASEHSRLFTTSAESLRSSKDVSSFSRSAHCLTRYIMGYPKWSYDFIFFNHISLHISHLPSYCTHSPNTPPSFLHPNNVWQKAQTAKFIIAQFSAVFSPYWHKHCRFFHYSDRNHTKYHVEVWFCVLNFDFPHTKAQMHQDFDNLNSKIRVQNFTCWFTRVFHLSRSFLTLYLCKWRIGAMHCVMT